jgi:7-cyano-7-deazaguanine synthase in queuosine biosynthesis
MEKPINLLWTSGSDSTFRLLEVLLVKKKTVQPYYIIDRGRRSLDFELEAMEKIKQLLFQKDASIHERLLPTIIKELSDIKPDEFITRQYSRLAAIAHLGIQYEWLPRFAKETGVHDLELSITSSNYSDYFQQFVKPSLAKVNGGEGYNYRLKENPANPDLTLFKYFRFPIIELSKLEMQQLARQHKFQDIMSHTWFCHSPKGKQPCGICNPCRIAIKEGMWRRIPLTGLLRNFSQYTIKPLLNGNFF